MTLRRHRPIIIWREPYLPVDPGSPAVITADPLSRLHVNCFVPANTIRKQRFLGLSAWPSFNSRLPRAAWTPTLILHHLQGRPGTLQRKPIDRTVCDLVLNCMYKDEGTIVSCEAQKQLHGERIFARG